MVYRAGCARGKEIFNSFWIFDPATTIARRPRSQEPQELYSESTVQRLRQVIMIHILSPVTSLFMCPTKLSGGPEGD